MATFICIVIIVALQRVLSEQLLKVNHVNWAVVESLAEENPHIVALLDNQTSYLCTGTVVSRRTVLTSGTCIKPELFYIAIGTAVLNKYLNKNNLFAIEKAIVHGDYMFGLRNEDLNVTYLHSNLGLVFSLRPELDMYTPAANIGNYYASELRNRDLVAVGFGPISDTENIALQFLTYHQSPCSNPKWYYCVCGHEITKYSGIAVQPFGEGAPVYLESELIGVTALPCGMLQIKAIGWKYNIITVLGPYLPWIKKSYSDSNSELFRSRNSAETSSFNVYLLLAVSRVLN